MGSDLHQAYKACMKQSTGPKPRSTCAKKVATAAAVKTGNGFAKHMSDSIAYKTNPFKPIDRRLASLAPEPELTTTSLIGPICGICLAIGLLATRFARRVTCCKARRKDDQ